MSDYLKTNNLVQKLDKTVDHLSKMQFAKSIFENALCQGCTRIMLDLADDGTGSTIDLNNLNSVLSIGLSNMDATKMLEVVCIEWTSDHWAMQSRLMLHHSDGNWVNVRQFSNDKVALSYKTISMAKNTANMPAHG